MSHRFALAGVCAIALAASGSMGWAQTAGNGTDASNTTNAAQSSVPPSAPADRKQVRAWLLRIHEAASQRNFQGTFVVTAGGAVSSARIAHFCEGNNQYERIDSLDGQARHVFRYNDHVHTLWPQSRVATVEQREPLSSFPSLLQSGDDRIAELYEVRQQGVERVAGHDANVLTVKPRDTLRFGYRLWSDQASGLLLRSDVLSERGELLESSAFSDVAIGVKSQTDLVVVPMKKLDGYRVLRPTMAPTKLEAEGWTLRSSVAGFVQVSCVKRPLDAAAQDEASGVSSGPAHAVHTIFSDGLTYVSLFIEPYNAQRHVKPVLTAIGATHTLMRRQGDWWLTVVGDVPVSTLRAFAAGLERKR
ncbi:MAG: MucB/RseB C-terminal domain-containing protein [Pseudorhodobacter sp.]|nr:MucB/RseB C-terminal domain-containing protein [Rhizobacter sp.]